MRLHFLLCLALAIVVGPARTPSPASDSNDRIRLLNQPHKCIAPGNVYVLDAGKAEFVLDLLGLRPLNEAGQWFKDTPMTTSPKFDFIDSVAVEWAADCCKCTRKARVYVGIQTSSLIHLGDPFECLEIVNRPVTGLEYNRDAETRIMQWRTSLSSAIARCANVHQAKVALCTGIEKASGIYVVIDVPAAGEDSARSSAETMLANTTVKLDWERRTRQDNWLYIPVPGEIILAAHFRELSAVDSTPVPHIDFKLEGATQRSVVPMSVFSNRDQEGTWRYTVHSRRAFRRSY